MRADPIHFLKSNGENVFFIVRSILNNSQEFAPYIYVSNNPINLLDPNGLTIQDAYKGLVFGFRAAGVVIKETAKIVTVDVGLALVNYVPLPPGVSFWTGRGLSGAVIHNNFLGLQQTAIQISQDIQSIRDEIFPITPSPSLDSFEKTSTPCVSGK